MHLMKHRTLLSIMIVGTAWGLVPASARAGFVASLSATVTPEAGGSFLYAYAINVSPSGTVAASEFDLSLPAPIDPTSIIMPTDFFSFYNYGDPDISFIALDAGILPGSSGTFSFMSTYGPGPVDSLVRGLDMSTYNVDDLSGTVSGPVSVSVPEPSSWLMAATAALGVAGLFVGNRRPGSTARTLALAVGLVTAGSMSQTRVMASDHADTAENVNRQGADLTDVFIFPSPNVKGNVVVVMDVHGLIPAGQGMNYSFDPRVLYQFKFDITGDHVEDLVIQARFAGVGPQQKVVLSGPSRPFTTGTTAVFAEPHPTIGTINQPFSIPLPGNQGAMMVFAGVRSDPFFFDLNRFYSILPDRMTPLQGVQIDYPSIMAADTPHPPISFRGFPDDAAHPAPQFDHSPSSDYLADLNVLSIVIELPRAALGGGIVRLWETTNVAGGAPGFAFMQQDRLARPAINEALATVTASRHEVNNKDNPTDDVNQLKHDIEAFLTFPAGRSTAIKTVLESVLVPDVMVADLSNLTDKASFLGVETGGATGGKFGGRDLRDDIVDIDLAAVFGGIVPALGLAPDDGNEIPQLTTDNVGPHNDFLDTFPYLGTPH